MKTHLTSWTHNFPCSPSLTMHVIVQTAHSLNSLKKREVYLQMILYENIYRNNHHTTLDIKWSDWIIPWHLYMIALCIFEWISVSMTRYGSTHVEWSTATTRMYLWGLTREHLVVHWQNSCFKIPREKNVRGYRGRTARHPFPSAYSMLHEHWESTISN